MGFQIVDNKSKIELQIGAFGFDRLAEWGYGLFETLSDSPNYALKYKLLYERNLNLLTGVLQKFVITQNYRRI